MVKIILLIKKMKSNQDYFLKIEKKYLSFIKKQEVLGEPFYDKLGQLKKFYLPIAKSIYKTYLKKKKTIVIGIAGGQGSGKSTIAKILKLILKNKYKLNSVNLSIDDFYKTLSERKKMSHRVHKLFLTRGVPGTHDDKILYTTIKKLIGKKFKSFTSPSFNKATDDRNPKSKWIKIKTKPHIIIFEGWCVGAKKQSKNILNKPINLLERQFDKQKIWRNRVNKELENNYKKIYNLIDKIVFLKVPNFKYIYKWRLLQEKKLKLSSKGKKIMSKEQIKKFIMFYERITRQMLKDFKYNANITIKLDKKHRLSKLTFN